jgi:hypothetical protein
LGSIVFCIAGGAIMSGYAIERHENYQKTFEDYPKHRRAIFPLIL